MKRLLSRCRKWIKKILQNIKWYNHRTVVSKYEKRLNRNLAILSTIVFAATVYITIVPCAGVRRMILGMASALGNDPTKMVSNFQKGMDFVGSSVWTLTTLLPPFITLYYSILGSRNYGLTNRKIISYTVGTVYIPFMVVYNALLVALMTWLYYAGRCTSFYMSAICSCLMQMGLIVICLMSTTRFAAHHAILYVEKKQVQELSDKCSKFQPKVDADESNEIDVHNMPDKLNESADGVRVMPNEEVGTDKSDKADEVDHERKKKLEEAMNDVVFHIENVLWWDEPFSEKRQMALDILMLPFEPTKGMDKISPYAVYKYTYQNCNLLVNYTKKLCQTERRGLEEMERRQVFDLVTDCFRQIIRERNGKGCLEDENPYACEKELMFFGAFLSAFVPESDFTERWVLFRYILNEVATDKFLRKMWIAEFLLCIQFDLAFGRLNSDDFEDMEGLSSCIMELRGLRMVLQEMEDNFGNSKGLRSDVTRQYLNMMLFWFDGSTVERIDQYKFIYEVCASFGERGGINYLNYFYDIANS